MALVIAQFRRKCAETAIPYTTAFKGYLLTLTINFEQIMVILKKSSPNQLLVNCRPTVDRQLTDRSIRLYKQLTDRLPTDQFDCTNS